MLVNGIDIQESKGITDQTWVVVTLREEWEGGEGQGGGNGQSQGLVVPVMGTQVWLTSN